MNEQVKIPGTGVTVANRASLAAGASGASERTTRPSAQAGVPSGSLSGSGEPQPQTPGALR